MEKFKINFKTILDYSMVVMVAIIFAILLDRVATGFWFLDLQRAPVTKIEPEREYGEPVFRVTVHYKNKVKDDIGVYSDLKKIKCRLEQEIKLEIMEEDLGTRYYEMKTSQAQEIESIDCNTK